LNIKDSLGKYALKLIFLGIMDALAIMSAVILFSDSAYLMLIGLILIVVTINFVYLVDKAYPMRYILPGTIFMVIFVVYPIFYTVYISFTNYGTGNILNKEQVVNQLKDNYFNPEDAEEFTFSTFKKENEKDFILLFENKKGEKLVGENENLILLENYDKEVIDSDNDGEIESINGYERLEAMQIYQHLDILQNLEFVRNDMILRMKNTQYFSSYIRQYEYDEKNDKIISLRSGREYYPNEDGFFEADDGEELTPGFRTNIGWRNYKRLLTDERVLNPFLRVFAWTIIWALLSVFSTFALGLFMAILLNDNTLMFRKLYRTILILPYSIPGFISVLVWRGLFNTEVGVINNVLEFFSIEGIAWMQSPFWAKVAVLIVNLWMGFPYMMLLALGALQSISHTLYEAAAIDGASAWQKFRQITLPLLLVSLGPLLISSFAFNFNNFNVIYLFNEGGPAIPGAQTPAGATDILISYTYNLSFATGRGADFGLASTVAMFIFIITAVITWFNFKYTGALEDVKENE